MNQEAVIRIKLDQGNLPQASQQAAASLGKIGDAGVASARQTAQAMRGLPAQLTDVATSLAGGQNPLLVLLQQGGQVRDQFGSIRAAAAGIASSVGPLGLVAGALAAVGAAAYQGARQSEELRDVVTLTGNAAGLTAARFEALAQTVEAASQQTIGASKDIVLELARSGQVSAGAIGAVAVAVARVADVTGQDGAKVAADFAKMEGGVAAWAAEHNKAWNFITVEQYKYIRRLEEQGKAEQAMIFTSQKVTEALAQQSENLGTLESMWTAVAKAASTAWNAMLAQGRTDLTSQLDAARAALGRAERGQGVPILEWLYGTPAQRQAQIDTLNRDLVRQVERSSATSAAAQANRAAIAKEREAERKGKGPAARDRERPYIPSEFQVLDARDGAVLAAAREKEASDFLGFVAEQEARQKAANDQRLTQQAAFLQQLQDANARAAAELIADERERGEALIRLDREIAERRLTEQGLTGGAREEAQRQLDEAARLRRYKLEQEMRGSASDLADKAGQQTYNDMRQALEAAFRDTSGNPVQAFANALGSAVFSRLTARIADALATMAVGADGTGGLVGSLIGLLKYSGSSTNVSAPNYENSFDLMNTPAQLATGTNYVPRDMLAVIHRGEAVVPAKYNPAAGGKGMGSASINVIVNVPPGVDQAQLAEVGYQAAKAGARAALEELKARGAY